MTPPLPLDQKQENIEDFFIGAVTTPNYKVVRTKDIKLALQKFKGKIDKRRFAVIPMVFDFVKKLDKVNYDLRKDFQNIIEKIDMGGLIDEYEEIFGSSLTETNSQHSVQESLHTLVESEINEPLIDEVSTEVDIKTPSSVSGADIKALGSNSNDKKGCGKLLHNYLGIVRCGEYCITCKEEHYCDKCKTLGDEK